ncbi:leucine Rich Repeat [Seminavis robusta]|uniref:Leucine Rich Repeat n=1 Tax=Seminavis robusta TaxID=568900 RepID=A0A9N8HLL4_9STRA|nr:leucine Rich Repeat [Seminavis robusta]|eukprot:Sro830_g208230.1 leucine Rich Repeat (713) ;mRNA; r:21336-23681
MSTTNGMNTAFGTLVLIQNIVNSHHRIESMNFSPETQNQCGAEGERSVDGDTMDESLMEALVAHNSSSAPTTRNEEAMLVPEESESKGLKTHHQDPARSDCVKRQKEVPTPADFFPERAGLVPGGLAAVGVTEVEEEMPGAYAVAGMASSDENPDSAQAVENCPEESSTRCGEDEETGHAGTGTHVTVADAPTLAEALPVEDAPTDLQVAESIRVETSTKRDVWVFMPYAKVLVALLICVVVVVAIVLGVKSGSPHEEETSGHAEELAIRMIVSNALEDPSTLQDVNSPTFRALDWILHVDPMQLGFDSPNLLQRFFVVLFYLSTTEEGPWVDCNPGADLTVEANDLICHHRVVRGAFEVGHVFYNHLLSPHDGTVATRWLTGRHECQWAGLYCGNNSSKIEWMQLDAMNLTGTIPAEFSLLDELKVVSLSGNGLYGTLPESLAALRHLQVIHLSDNAFGGTIPPDWWNIHTLLHLDLSYNPLNSWTIPSAITALSQLEYLILTDSETTGTIPASVYQLTNLRYLAIRYNDITGTISSEIGLLSNLEVMSFKHNVFSGSLPSEVAQLSNLLELDVWGTGLTGTIPEELYFADYAGLNALILGYNQFSGTISSNLVRLSHLSYLLLTHNPLLVGTLPSELALMSSLYKITLDGTGLTGSVPAELCAQRGEMILGRVNADCETLPDGTTPLFCPVGCCTKCCNSETGICTKTGY